MLESNMRIARHGQDCARVIQHPALRSITPRMQCSASAHAAGRHDFGVLRCRRGELRERRLTGEAQACQRGKGGLLSRVHNWL